MSTNTKWSISYETGYGIDGCRLSICQFVEVNDVTKLRHGAAHGTLFSNRDLADRWVEDHGYVKPWGRNVRTFASNRSFRRHTGRDEIDSSDIFWNMKKSNGQRHAEEKLAGG